jgi:hypothetical protein
MFRSRSAGVAFAAALAFTAFPGRAHALEFTLGTVEALQEKFPDGFGPCRSDACGGFFIRWQGLGFGTNPQAQLHIDNLLIGMSSEVGEFGGLMKVKGNVMQTANILVQSGPMATFTMGSHTYTNILSMTLQSNGAVDFKGKQLLDEQHFTLTIQTTTQKIVFNLCSEEGSLVNFNKAGVITGLNFRFCGSPIGTPPPPPPPPPPIPEPTSLFALGLVGVGLLRRRLFV